MAGEKIDELLVGLRLDQDRQSFAQAESSFASLRRGALSFTAAVGGGLGLDQMTRGVAAARDQMGLTAKEINITTRELDSLQFAFEQSGGSAETAVSSLRSANDALDQLQLGRSDGMDLASMWGLEAAPLMEANDALEFMLRLSEQLEGRSTQQRRNILEAFGMGGEGTLELMSGGRENVEALMGQSQEIGPTVEGLDEASRDFNQSLGKMERAVTGVTDVISLEMIKDMTALADILSGIIGENRDGIVGALTWEPPWFKKEFWDGAGEWFGGIEIGQGQGKGTTSPREMARGSDSMSWLEAIAQTESGGRHRDDSGDLITSPTGAEGMYQIIPSTGRDPGYGVDPLRGDSQSEHERFAKDYLGALESEYDSEELATIAYNAGPGNLDRWLSESSDWREGAAKDMFSGSEHRQFVARQALDYEGKVEGYLGRDLRGGSGGNTTQNNTFNISGSDPQQNAREVEKILRRTADQARQDTANEVY